MARSVGPLITTFIAGELRSWLRLSSPILLQTIGKLRNPKHPRSSLEYFLFLLQYTSKSFFKNLISPRYFCPTLLLFSVLMKTKVRKVDAFTLPLLMIIILSRFRHIDCLRDDLPVFILSILTSTLEAKTLSLASFVTAPRDVRDLVVLTEQHELRYQQERLVVGTVYDVPAANTSGTTIELLYNPDAQEKWQLFVRQGEKRTSQTLPTHIAEFLREHTHETLTDDDKKLLNRNLLDHLEAISPRQNVSLLQPRLVGENIHALFSQAYNALPNREDAKKAINRKIKSLFWIINNKEHFIMKSKVDSNLRFTENLWIISLINTKSGTGGVLGGHAKIIVEGIIRGDPATFFPASAFCR